MGKDERGGWNLRFLIQEHIDRGQVGEWCRGVILLGETAEQLVWRQE